MGTAVLRIVHDDIDVSTFIPTSYMIAYKVKADWPSHNYSTSFSSSTNYYKDVDEILISLAYRSFSFYCSLEKLRTFIS